MSRDMKKANQKFFCNIRDCLDEDLSSRISDGVRYIVTDDEEKEWLKHALIKRVHRFSKNSYGLLLLYSEKEYLCLINTGLCNGKLPDILEEKEPNSGLITFLGSEGYLTPKIDRKKQLEIFDKVLYAPIDYHGHNWSDIESYFPNVCSYEICLQKGTAIDIDIRENKNAFYWILCQVALEFDMSNNPFSEISKDAWEKIIYEGNLDSIEFKNLLLAYTALSWDITYLYLYQCLEDKFSYASVQTLCSKLELGITPQQFSNLLYDELSWQPKDLEGIESIIKKCSAEARAIAYLKSVSGEQDLAKFIYSTRNRIVHETREAPIPLSENETWEKTIAGMVYLLQGI